MHVLNFVLKMLKASGGQVQYEGGCISKYKGILHWLDVSFLSFFKEYRTEIMAA